MAEAVCVLLRKLANTGKIVVCVIHQPSSDTFNLFTHLCLLAKGRMAYLGELSKAVDYFASIGHACPANFNPADFFIEELAVVPSEYEKSMARLRLVTDAYANSELRQQVGRSVFVLACVLIPFSFDLQTIPQNPNRASPPSLTDPSTISTLRAERPVAEQAGPRAAQQAAPKDGHRYHRVPRHAQHAVPRVLQAHLHPGTFARSRVCMCVNEDRRGPTCVDGRTLAHPTYTSPQHDNKQQYRREPVLTRARLVNSMLMGLLLGMVYFQQDESYKAVQNKMGVAFIVTINQCISATFGVVQEVPRDFAVFMREYLAGANRVSAYFLARTISEIPFQVRYIHALCH